MLANGLNEIHNGNSENTYWQPELGPISILNNSANIPSVKSPHGVQRTRAKFRSFAEKFGASALRGIISCKFKQSIRASSGIVKLTVFHGDLRCSLVHIIYSSTSSVYAIRYSDLYVCLRDSISNGKRVAE